MIELERDKVGMMTVSRPRPDQTKNTPPITDTFWIPVDSETDRRNSLSRKDGLSFKTKCDRDVKESEKHWQLQKKVCDLNAQSVQLEKRISALKEENEVLKKKTEDYRSTEEKVKKLKKRNAELASIARRLEEKLKQVQQETPKKTVTISPSIETSSSKHTPNKAKTKDRPIERVKSATDKDKVIEMMRERFQELLRQQRSVQDDNLKNKDFYTEQTELESIIKVAAKERLQLEKQLIDEQHNPEVEAQLAKVVHLEQRNAELVDEVERLTKFADEKEKLEIEVMQRRIEIEVLEKQVVESNNRCSCLNEELQDMIDQNTQLTVVNTDFAQQIEELDQMAENYKSLSASLAAAESEAQRAKSEAAVFNDRVQTLETELQYLEQVEQKKCLLESEKQSLQESLRLMELELDAVTKKKKVPTATLR